MDDIISRIQQRILDPLAITEGADCVAARVYPPADETALNTAENSLGFRLPPLLRRLYLEIGNGGFGPGYGLLGVQGGARDDRGQNVIELYQEYTAPAPDDPHWRWPHALLPVCNLGCGMYACVDCLSADGPVIWFEPNPHVEGESWDDSFIPIAASMEEWLSAWLEDRDLPEEGWKRKFGNGE